mmetsp:Transcript_2553/g.4477  ORF Transcript_2553/g.4477 Transcript_2553/m.4477 type:complete len:1057 (-) Transcript_2553:213-3383(-)|eukprot:CAMPEP_0184683428 /NCGR_PEP_ID=MMETSP0312-20130426/11316_1 /TAXON_ID=31354 /ORGANISM="Compsopogon coeruleus, Strain SAG 36.94" /LENGTH=1056 /DNA_ID=CAMNT_0027135789 /DNA_START=432 /DNA_END=3602 /DNA_ORIENTATION=+
MTDQPSPQDLRDNEFIAELVRLLELHGNDDFKRKHAEIPMLLQQLDMLTKKRKRQEETLQKHNNRVSRLQDLSRCHREILDLSKKTVKWLGNGLSTAELLSHGSEGERVDRIDNIRSRAVKAGREAQVRDAVERLESLKQRLLSGLEDMGERNVNINDELELFIASLMKKERHAVEKTRENINSLQCEVQKVDEELQCAESALQRAISSAYQNAVKQNGAEFCSGLRQGSEAGGVFVNSDDADLSLGIFNHSSALNGLEIIQSTLDDDSYDLGDELTEDEQSDCSTLSEDSEAPNFTLPGRCAAPKLTVTEQSNGKLRIDLDLAGTLDDCFSTNVAYLIEAILESHSKSAVVKSNSWSYAIPLPNEDAELQVRVRAKNSLGMGEFSDWTVLHVEGVRSRKRRLAVEKEKMDKASREVEAGLVDELSEAIRALKDINENESLNIDNAASFRERAKSILQQCLSLHAEKRLRPSNEASTVIRVAKGAIKDSEKLESNHHRKNEILKRFKALSSRTACQDLSERLSRRSREDIDRIVKEAEIEATTLFLEWNEFVNDLAEGGVPDDLADEFRQLYLHRLTVLVENCGTPPRALGDLLELSILKTWVFGPVTVELESLLTCFRRKRATWLRFKEHAMAAKQLSDSNPNANVVKSVAPKTSEWNKKSKETASRAKMTRLSGEGLCDHRRTLRESVEEGRKRGSGQARSKSESDTTVSRKQRRPTEQDRPKRPLRSLVIGNSYAGSVVGIARFGFFVDIGCEKPGLVHISAIRPGYIANVYDEVSIHDDVVVRVVSVNLEKKTFSCTLRCDVEVLAAENQPSRQECLSNAIEMDPLRTSAQWPILGEEPSRPLRCEIDGQKCREEATTGFLTPNGFCRSESDADGTICSRASSESPFRERFPGLTTVFSPANIAGRHGLTLPPQGNTQISEMVGLSEPSPIDIRQQEMPVVGITSMLDRGSAVGDDGRSMFPTLNTSVPSSLPPLTSITCARKSNAVTDATFSAFGGQYSIFGGVVLANTLSLPRLDSTASSQGMIQTGNSSGNLESEMDEMNSRLVNSLLL